MEVLQPRKGQSKAFPHPKGWEWLLGLGRKGEEGFIPNLGSLDADRKGSGGVPSVVKEQLTGAGTGGCVTLLLGRGEETSAYQW